VNNDINIVFVTKSYHQLEMDVLENIFDVFRSNNNPV